MEDCDCWVLDWCRWIPLGSHRACLLHRSTNHCPVPTHLHPPFDPTWFNIAVPIIIASIVVFLFLAYFIQFSRCNECIDAKKGVIVSLIFLSAGWAAWSLGRLLNNAVITLPSLWVMQFDPLPPALSSPPLPIKHSSQSLLSTLYSCLPLDGTFSPVALTTVSPSFSLSLPLLPLLATGHSIELALNVLSYVGDFHWTPSPSSIHPIDPVCSCHWFCLDHCSSPVLCDCKWCW